MDLTNLNKDRRTPRKPSVDISTMVYGKVQPQDKKAEVKILGAIMREKGAFESAAEILKPECFYVDAHQIIFRAMTRLWQVSQPIDEITMMNELRRTEELETIGGPYFLTKLTGDVVSAANIEIHCRIVLEKFLAREVIRVAGEMVAQAYDDSTDIFDLLEDTENSMYNISQNYMSSDFSSIAGPVATLITQIENLRINPETLTGVPSGYPRIDRLTGGWQPTELKIIAARPSVGKTAFALNLARNAAMHPVKPTAVLYFSLEMSKIQLVRRILAIDSGLWLEGLKRGKISDNQMKDIYTSYGPRLAKAPIYIDDTSSLNVFELRAKARRARKKFNVGLIIIDYLQLMSGAKDKGGNREQEISSISRNLKGLAKDLEVPVIALSQLSREVEKRQNRMPQLSDLRESGAIEQDADMVMFLYRPSKEEQDQDASLRDTGMVKIAKFRDGELDDILFRIMPATQKWSEMNEDQPELPGNWKPVPEVRDITEPKKEEGEDLPF